MPALPPRGEGRIDYAGAALIVVGFTALLLAVTWGGRDYGWGSPMILGLLAASLVSLTAFVFVQRAVRDPILPLALFKNRTFNTANGAAFIYSMAFMGVTSFLPLYMQVGQGVPATRSGLTMLALMVGLVGSSTISGQLVTRTGDYKPFMIGGGSVLLAGVLSLCFIGPDTSTFSLAWRLLIVGIGLGPGQSLFSLAVQNAVPPHQLGVATSSGQFVRQIGSTMGVALFGAILTWGLTSELGRLSAADPAAHMQTLELSDLQRMAMERDADPGLAAVRAADPATRAADQIIRQSFSTAVVYGIVFSLAVLILGFLLMLKIPGVRLADRVPPPAPAPTPAEALGKPGE
jgi:MFS family permease